MHQPERFSHARSDLLPRPRQSKGGRQIVLEGLCWRCSRQHGRPNHGRWRTGYASLGRGNGMEIQEKKSAVGVIGLAGRRLRLKDRIDTMQIFLPIDRRGLRLVASDEIALRVYGGVDPMVDQSPSPRD